MRARSGPDVKHIYEQTDTLRIRLCCTFPLFLVVRWPGWGGSDMSYLCIQLALYTKFILIEKRDQEYSQKFGPLEI